MTRGIAAIVSIGLVGAALEPLLRAPEDDGFPLSTYPMFAAARPVELTLAYAQGVTRGGAARRLGPVELGTGEVMQAFVALQRVADAEIGDRAALCAAIAARAADRDELRDVVAIRIVRATYDAVAHVARGAPARDEAIVARCEVARGAPEPGR